MRHAERQRRRHEQVAFREKARPYQRITNHQASKTSIRSSRQKNDGSKRCRNASENEREHHCHCQEPSAQAPSALSRSVQLQQACTRMRLRLNQRRRDNWHTLSGRSITASRPGLRMSAPRSRFCRRDAQRLRWQTIEATRLSLLRRFCSGQLGDQLLSLPLSFMFGEIADNRPQGHDRCVLVLVLTHSSYPSFCALAPCTAKSTPTNNNPPFLLDSGGKEKPTWGLLPPSTPVKLPLSRAARAAIFWLNFGELHATRRRGSKLLPSVPGCAQWRGQRRHNELLLHGKITAVCQKGPH